jgi:hypothetical protein
MFSVGDRVKVVQVIKPDGEYGDRNKEKSLLIGAFSIITSIRVDGIPFPGQIYHIKGTPRSFHADEFELVVDMPKKTYPEVGDIVYVAGSKTFRKVKTVKTVVTFVNEKGDDVSGQYFDIVPPELIVQQEKDALLKKQAELMQKQSELMLKVKDVMDEANKVSLELIQIEKK